jgi:hypothetical protein
MKCRKELASISLLPELLQKLSSDDNEDETAPCTCTVQDPNPDLELKLEIQGSSREEPTYVKNV